MGEVTPYNRIENFLAKGSGADVSPYNRLERILAGEDLEPTNRLEYFAKEAASGGGNPNSVQTIEGTLNWPFGLNGISFANDIYTGNATAWLDLDCTILGLGVVTYPVIGGEGGSYLKIFATAIDSSGAFDSEAQWDYYEDGGINWYLSKAFLINASGGEYTITDMDDYKDLLPTTLTIIWHPLPT